MNLKALVIKCYLKINVGKGIVLVVMKGQGTTGDRVFIDGEGLEEVDKLQ